MKKCPGCQKILSLESFCNNRSRKDGKAHYCKTCHSKNALETKIKYPDKCKVYSRNTYLKRKNSFKVLARRQAYIAKRSGEIPHDNCLICGEPGETMHHDDYNRPLDITWYCWPCHRQIHRAMKAKFNSFPEVEVVT